MASKRTFGGKVKATNPLQKHQAHDRNKEGSLGNHLVLVGMSQQKMDDMWWHVFRHANFFSYNDHLPGKLLKAIRKMLQDANPGKDAIKDFLMLLRSHNCPMFSPFSSTSTLYSQHNVMLQGNNASRVTGHLFACLGVQGEVLGARSHHVKEGDQKGSGCHR
jgi:hypothetical protein